MQISSTRNKQNIVTFSKAIVDCLPQDGGMYVPAKEMNLRPWISYMNENTSFSSIAGALTSALINEELSPIISENIATRAFPFSPELKQLDEKLYLLELFHGPTGCHKDFGISYLASCLEHILIMENKNATVLAISNGETGACIAKALENKKHLKAIILYTKGSMRGLKESDFVWNGGNIYPVEVDGNEDDCFKVARELFDDRSLIEKYNLTLANTHNIGRLLPQTFFYTYAFSRLKNKCFTDIFYALSADNYGNLVAGLYSWKFSLPVNGFITDSTPSLYADATGDCTVLDSIIPLEKRGKADPLNPSNIERLEEVFCTNPAVIKGFVFPAKVTKQDAGNALKEMFTKYHEFIDLQTASAYAASKIRSDVTNDQDGTIVLVSRNHPSLSQKEIKFWCGEEPTMPDHIKELYVKIEPKHKIKAEKSEVVKILEELNF